MKFLHPDVVLFPQRFPSIISTSRKGFVVVTSVAFCPNSFNCLKVTYQFINSQREKREQKAKKRDFYDFFALFATFVKFALRFFDFEKAIPERLTQSGYYAFVNY